MGLISDTIDFVGDTITNTVDAIGDAISGTSETIDNTTDSITQTLSNTIDSTTNSVESTEDSINDGVTETTQDAGQVLDGGTESVFDVLAGGADTLEGFFNAIAGAFEWARGITDLPGFPSGIGSTWEFLMNGAAGVFHGIAGVVATIQGFFAFVGGLDGFEGAAFLLGVLMIFLAGYMVITSFGLQAFDAGIVGFVGIGLVTYASANLIGSILIGGAGLILVSTALLAERSSFFIFGIPVYFLGLVMLFTSLKLGFLAVFILTAAAILGVIFAAEYLEKRLGPRVGMDQPILVGE